MKKTAFLLILALIICQLSPAALAAAQQCGDSVYWSYNSATRTLTFSGSGRMYDYTSKNLPPWYDSYIKYGKVDNIEFVDGDITYIGDYAFHGLHVPNVTLPDTVLEIGKNAFDRSEIRTIHLPAQLETIGYEAFSGGTHLESIVIPDRVTTIGISAFDGCSHATSLTLPAGLKTISFTSFSGMSSLTELELPEGLETLGSSAFSNCTQLDEVTIPASVTSVGTSPFWGCSALEAIHVAPGNPVVSEVDGVLFNKAGTTLLQYPAGRMEESYTVPDTVTRLNSSAFAGCMHLKRATIPDGIAELPLSVFRRCPELTHVDLPDTITKIDRGAFYQCPLLTELDIPYGVTELGQEAFWQCGLQRVSIPETVTSFGNYLFDYCPTELTLYVIAGSPAHSYAVNNRKNFAFLSPFDRADLVLPGDLTTIEDEAFMGADAAIVYLPAGVTEIGHRAFAGCPNLKHINLPDGASIATDAFDDCGAVYLYGASGSAAEAYASSHDNVTFVALEQ